MPDPANLLEEVTSRLREADRVVVLTGAGISAESGVPTFRDAQTGLWANYEPTQLATPEAFRENPKLVWEWYQWRRDLIANVEPNAGHYALVVMETHVPEFTLVTQNVDNLHHVAGSSRILELHGNIFRTKRSGDGTIVETWQDGEAVPPRCPTTGQRLRPDVVWFGEPLPEAALRDAFTAAEACDLCLAVGTSAVVHPAASIPVIAKRAGAFVVEINPEPTPLSDLCNISVRSPSGKLLPDLVARAWPATDESAGPYRPD